LKCSATAQTVSWERKVRDQRRIRGRELFTRCQAQLKQVQLAAISGLKDHTDPQKMRNRHVSGNNPPSCPSILARKEKPAVGLPEKLFRPGTENGGDQSRTFHAFF
jgi:hypothetical protein